MAKLSQRIEVDTTIYDSHNSTKGTDLLTGKRVGNDMHRNTITQEDLQYLRTYTKQENTMTTNNTLKEVTITLIDNNINLEDKQRIVFQKKGVQTSNSLEDTKMNVIASGEVMAALTEHNEEVRACVVNEDILDRTGREVFLKPIKLLSDSQLEWRVVETA
jgi:hypothetical protein